MALNKVEKNSNMYSWVDFTHSHLAGRCLHECQYCYVQSMGKRFPAIREKYSGKIRIIEDEFRVNYGSGKTIFIEHMNDLLAEGVPGSFIKRILAHCNTWPDNTYIFQTKNPASVIDYEVLDFIPEKCLIGTTVESDINYNISKAPVVSSRIESIADLSYNYAIKIFITVEPILRFNLPVLSDLIIQSDPEFVNIGADSKKSGLPEPTWNEVQELVDILEENNIEVRQKKNLDRLKAYKP